MDNITEAFKIKVNSKGIKRRKLKCPQGHKPNPSGAGCIPITSTEKRTRKVGARHAVRTVKAKGASAKRTKVRKMKKALRFRKSFGLSR